MKTDIMMVNNIECYEENGTAYLKLEAVARGLGFTHTERSGNESVRWDRVRKYLDELGAPTCGCDAFIPENIFYRLAMKANNETASAFQKMVADEILPIIRRTGGYVANDDMFVETYLPFADEATQGLFRTQLLVIRQQNALISNQRAQLEEQKPQVEFAETVQKSCDNILMRDMAKLLCHEEVQIGEKRMYRLLREKDILMSDNSPYQTYIDRGYFKVKEGAYTTPYGSIKLNNTTLVTPKGQVWLVNKVREWVAA